MSRDPEDARRRVASKFSFDEDGVGSVGDGGPAQAWDEGKKERPASEEVHSNDSPMSRVSSTPMSRVSSTASRRRRLQSQFSDLPPPDRRRRSGCVYRKSVRLNRVATVENVSHSGPLADLLLRACKKRKVKVPLLEKTSPLETVLSNTLYQEKGGHKALTYGCSLLKREQLRDLIMTRITEESKERGTFERNSLQDVVRWARAIAKQKADVTRLRKTVDAWTFTWKITHMTSPPSQESMWTKKERVEDFWSTLHDRALILTEPVLAKPDDGAIDQERRSPFQLSRRPSLGAAGIACGMSWEHEQGVRWKALSKLPGGSRPGTSGGGGISGGATLGRPTSLPTLHRAATPGGSGSRPGSSAARLGTPGSRPTTSPCGGQLMTLGPKQKVLPPLTSSRCRYLQECDVRKQPPRALGLLMGDKCLHAQGKGLADEDLLAVAATIAELRVVEEVDLSDNSLLTDRSLVELFRQLANEPSVSVLRKLSLCNCVRASSYTVDATVGLLKAGSALRLLDLSHVQIPARFQLPLCQAIGKHRSLEVVNLSETGLQHHGLTKDCLREVLSSSSVHTLDVGWNLFNGVVFEAMGGYVVQNRVLRTLRVANCATASDICGADDVVPPLSLFLEQLAHDKTLKVLDISMNRCDFRTALILEDALDTHTKLKELIMQHNPLGPFGLRSILRLVCREHTGLQVFDTEGCYLGGVPRAGVPVYSFTNPGGKYDLQLWRPYHRTMLRMLYKAMDFFGLTAEEAFEKVAYSVKSVPTPWRHCSKDYIGVWEVPSVGDLSLVFNVEKAIFKRFITSSTQTDFNATAFLQKFYEVARFNPGARKVIPMFARWADLGGDAKAQEVFLNALSKDFNLSVPQLEHMCEVCHSKTNDVISRLLPLVGIHPSVTYITGLLFPRITDFVLVHQKLQHFTNLNVDNPTGRYQLDLSNCGDFAAAERVFLVDRWEAAIDRKHGRQDVSRCGNMSHVRNEMYQGRSLQDAGIHSVAEWNLPEHGDLSFDYVSNQRPSRKQPVLSQTLWDTLLIELYQADCPPADKIAALRSISHMFYLESAHVRAMMGYFKTPEDRLEVLVAFYMRIVDMHNAKLFRVRFDDRKEVESLQQRLGYVSFFPFFQPENAQFELDLSVPDQQLCACMFVQLAIKEKYANLRDYSYRKSSGALIPLPIGVPKSWGVLKTIPSEGVFTATYRSAPEDRDFAFRRELARTYGFFDVDGLQETDVEWWTGLTEPPEDVLNLLEFFISRFSDVEQAFKQIDGPGGNGLITFRELLDGLEEMGCTKFDAQKGHKASQTREQRIETIFRYLDPGGEGSVSRDEWNTLGQLWKEFDLSIREFVHFLVLTFGDDLRDAWDELDYDESESLTEEEWLKAVQDIGYFGPAKVVFALLDMSDDNEISFEEFEVLSKYKANQ
mmetsp:Transcript_130542/g.377640  ORF Transcript_130542/g.377640 Transcript_130542/m.377640 type:complete len:1409 (+) Transcript_130542:86-4312(+)